MNNNSFSKSIWIGVFIVLIFIIIMVGVLKSRNRNSTYEYVKYNQKYEGKENQINYKEISETKVAQMYLADYVNIILTDMPKAYSLVDDYYKENVLETFSKFNKRVENMKTPLFISAKLKEVSVQKYNGNRIYYVKDAADNVFVFKEVSIMNYTVYLDTDTLDI